MEGSSDRENSTPFLLKLFYRPDAFHRSEELASQGRLPPHVTVYTWMSCTLTELSHALAAAVPGLLPDPAVGTRLAFRLVYQDATGRGAQPPRLVTRDLGSVVVGSGGSGGDEDDGADVNGGAGDHIPTLAEAKFVVGDYVSCAILPPLDGPGGAIRPPPAAAAAELHSSTVLPPTRRESGLSAAGRGLRGRGGRWADGGERRGYHQGRDRDGDGSREWERHSDFPAGEWRRGEMLPENPRGRGRGRASRW